MSTHFNPEIYVVCLASYNTGDIHGCMIDATLSCTEIWRKISSMLTESPYYEGQKKWLILGYEGFGDICIDSYMGENADYQPIATLATAIKKNKDLVIAALHYYRYTDSLITALEERYRGEWDSELEFTKYRLRCKDAEGYHTSCWSESDMERIKDNLFRYDDIMETYFSLTVGNKVHVFSHH